MRVFDLSQLPSWQRFASFFHLLSTSSRMECCAPAPLHNSSSSQLSMALQTRKPGTAEMDIPKELFTSSDQQSH
jgi:hypothetical protein